MKYDEKAWQAVKDGIRAACRDGAWRLPANTVREKVLPALGLDTYPNGGTFFDIAYGAWGNNSSYMDMLGMLEDLVDALPEPPPPFEKPKPPEPEIFDVPGVIEGVTVEFIPSSCNGPGKRNKYAVPGHLIIRGIDPGHEHGVNDQIILTLPEASMVVNAIDIAKREFSK